jgi:high-affinity iron transporter
VALRAQSSTRRAAPLAVVALAFTAALAFPGAAEARDVSNDEAVDEVVIARDLVDRAVDAASDGDREQAYELARTAYLEHFELVEIPMRLRDPNLVLDMEFDFADLRDGIRAGDDIGEVRDDARIVQSGLDDVERDLTEKGVAAPLVAFGFSFSILFREGLEAVLLIAILLGSLEAARASNYRRPLAWGAAGAVAATVVTFALAMTVIEIAPFSREVMEAVAAVLAVVVLFAVTFWLVSRLEQRRWMEFMRSRVSAAVTAGGAAAFVGLGFTAIYREGFETVLFYQALTLFAEGLLVWVALGAATAAVVLAGLGYSIFALGRKLPIKPMLVTGASILLVLSIAFAGNAVRSLQSVDVIGATPIDGEWARLPIFLAELTGIHPTVEGIAVQAALALVYVAGALYVFAWRPARERRVRSSASAVHAEEGTG